jgi:hypothetical protein
MASVLALGASTGGAGGAVATADGFGTAVAGGLEGWGTGVDGFCASPDGGRRLGACCRTTLTDTEGSWTGRAAARFPTR